MKMKIKSFKYEDLVNVVPECLWGELYYAKPQSVEELGDLARSELMDNKELSRRDRVELRGFLRDLPDQTLEKGLITEAKAALNDALKAKREIGERIARVDERVAELRPVGFLGKDILAVERSLEMRVQSAGTRDGSMTAKISLEELERYGYEGLRPVVTPKLEVEEIAREIETLPWYVQERALETVRGAEQDVRFPSLADLSSSERERLAELLSASYERALEREGMTHEARALSAEETLLALGEEYERTALHPKFRRRERGEVAERTDAEIVEQEREKKLSADVDHMQIARELLENSDFRENWELGAYDHCELTNADFEKIYKLRGELVQEIEEDKTSKEKKFYHLEADGANDSHYLCETSGGKTVRIARFNDLAKAEAVRERFTRMEAERYEQSFERSENVEEQEQGMQL